jgi:hypothetical protein
VPETEADSPTLPTQGDADWDSILDCSQFAKNAAIGFTGIHRMIADHCETHRRFEAAFTIP